MSEEAWNAAKARLSLYSIIGLMQGLFALVWAGHSLHLHHRGGGQVSKRVVFLLLSDILQVILMTLVVASLQHYSLCSADGFDCFKLSCFLGAIRLWGLCFHQLVAIEGLCHRHPCLCFATFYTVLLFVIWYLSTAMFRIISEISAIFVFLLYAGCIVQVVVMALTVKPSWSCDPPSQVPQRPSSSVLAVAIFTLVFLYGPIMVWSVWFVITHDMTGTVDLSDFVPFGSMFACLMSFQVVADSLLCVLVCRETVEKKPTETKVDDENREEVKADLDQTLQRLLLI